MKLYRMWGIFLRYMFAFYHTLDRLADVFFWPTVDLVLWGLTSRFFTSSSSNSQMLLGMLISGLVLWIFPWRAQYELGVNLLEDVWNRNLINIFATPVRFREWVMTLLSIGIAKGIISFSFAGVLAYLLYATNIFKLGIYLFPWAVIITLFGWVFGMLVTSAVMSFGKRIQTLAWTSIYIVVPFAAVYYPVSTLPGWAQTVAHYVPASYVFEAMRAAISGHPMPLSALMWPTVMSLLYLAISFSILVGSYQKLLRRGLMSVE